MKDSEKIRLIANIIKTKMGAASRDPIKLELAFIATKLDETGDNEIYKEITRLQEKIKYTEQFKTTKAICCYECINFLKDKKYCTMHTKAR